MAKGREHKIPALAGFVCERDRECVYKCSHGSCMGVVHVLIFGGQNLKSSVIFGNAASLII